jgi:hypothetical protein
MIVIIGNLGGLHSLQVENSTMGGGVQVAQKLAGSQVPRRVLYRVYEAVVLLGLSRSQLYELIDRAGCRLSQKDACG